MPQTHLSWDQFVTDIQELASDIRDDSSFTPDFLLGIARGGWIPTYYLSTILSVKNIASIGIKYTDKDRTVREIYSLPDALPKNARVLLIEDILESGRSMEEAAHILEEKGVEVYTAALYIAKNALYVPDFYVRRFDLTPIMPWEEFKRAA